MRIAGPVLACALAVVAGGCGAEGAWGDDAGDDAPDGGPSGDAGCSIGVAYTPGPPVSDVVEGDTVTMRATGVEGGDFFEYHWTVNGSADGLTPAADDDSAMTYTFAEAGTYDIALDVDGSPCLAFSGVLPVRALGATETQWRLRVTPPLTSGTPPQDLIRTVPSGADWDLEIALDPGAVISGTIVDGDGAGVPAYLRLTPTSTPDLAIDGFAGATGEFAVRATLVRHDLLIIPYRVDLAPRRLASWSPQSGAQIVDAGTAVSGTVLDPAGAGLVGATVTLRIDGVPSSVGTTGADGAFTVRARPVADEAVEVVVVPPAIARLPRLRASLASLDLGSPLEIEYADTLVRRDVAGTSVTVGGVAAAGATVTFTASMAGVGLVRNGVASSPQATGHFALEASCDGSGVLGSASIPAAAGVAVVTPATGTAGAVDVDLTSSVPATIVAPASPPVTGRVVGPTGSPVGGADLRAVPTGALATAGLDELHLVAAADGTFSLPLVAGGAYDLTVRDRTGELALRRQTWSAGPLGDVALPDGMHLGGRVSLTGSSTVIGAAITVFCETCPTRTLPEAEAATDGGGRFRTTVLDPGTE